MYYFVSKEQFQDGTILHPRVPVNRMFNEDDTTPRICCSSSIDGCLTAVEDFNVDDVINVYIITPLEEDSIITPTEHQVIDAPITGEQWIMCDAELKLFCVIEIFDVFPREIGCMFMNSYSYGFIG